MSTAEQPSTSAASSRVPDLVPSASQPQNSGAANAALEGVSLDQYISSKKGHSARHPKFARAAYKDPENYGAYWADTRFTNSRGGRGFRATGINGPPRLGRKIVASSRGRFRARGGFIPNYERPRDHHSKIQDEYYSYSHRGNRQDHGDHPSRRIRIDHERSRRSVSRSRNRSETPEHRLSSSSAKVKVFNLPDSITIPELGELFGQFGQLTSSKLEPLRKGQIGILEFRALREARKAAKEYDQAELDGKTLKVVVVGDQKTDIVRANRGIKGTDRIKTRKELEERGRRNKDSRAEKRAAASKNRKSEKNHRRIVDEDEDVSSEAVSQDKPKNRIGSKSRRGALRPTAKKAKKD